MKLKKNKRRRSRSTEGEVSFHESLSSASLDGAIRQREELLPNLPAAL